MKAFRISVVIGLAVMLAVAAAGCGALGGQAAKEAVERGTGVKVDEGGKKVTIKTDKGTVEAEGGEGKLPSDFPSKFPVYQGATVKSGAKTSTPDATMFTVTWEVAGAAAQVVEFYKKALPDNGYKVESTMESAGTTGFVLKDSSAVSIREQSGKTEIVVVLNQK